MKPRHQETNSPQLPRMDELHDSELLPEGSLLWENDASRRSQRVPIPGHAVSTAVSTTTSETTATYVPRITRMSSLFSDSATPFPKTLFIETEALRYERAGRGRRMHFPGRGISTAFSTKTSQTAETFVPRLSSVSSLKLEKEEEIEVMSFDDLGQYKAKSEGSGMKKMMWGVISIIGSLMILGSLDFFVFNIFLDVKGPSNNFQSGEDNFCAEGDENVREFLAREFDKIVLEGSYLSYSDNDIKCLPSFCFSALNSTQKEQLSLIRGLHFTNTGLKEISELAFGDQELRNLTTLKLNYNSISNLADEILSPLTHLRYLFLGFNNFRKLDSDVFRNSKSLLKIYMNNNPLVEIPNALVGWKTSQRFYGYECPSLASFQDQMFSNSRYPKLGLRGTKLALEYEDPKELQKALGINSTSNYVSF